LVPKIWSSQKEQLSECGLHVVKIPTIIPVSHSVYTSSCPNIWTVLFEHLVPLTGAEITMSISIKSLLARNDGRVKICETHDRLSTEIIKHTVGKKGQIFDGVWYSGLTQTTYLGVPDTELLSPLQRAVLLALNGNIQRRETHRPLCAAFDADSGGNMADIPALVAVLALVGVSMIIIEDKTVSAPGQKVNSLKDSSASQDQADMYKFAKTIRAFRAVSAKAGKDMMITARIESFTGRKTEKNDAEERASVQLALADALKRAEVYREAGVDAIMIHSKSLEPEEVISFLTQYRARDAVTPLVVVPTAYSRTLKTALYEAGANLIIYANHLLRAKISAVGSISDKILAANPNFLSEYSELRACFEARNYGCLLRRLWERLYLGEEDKEAQLYRVVTETAAAENMKAVVRDLLDGELCGCEADHRIISVKDLLKINTCQVTLVEDLVG
jgi:2-methylisocitrate lyase-like PEP mutase family enzyme